MIRLLLDNINQFLNINSHYLIIISQLTHKLKHVSNAYKSIIIGVKQMKTKANLFSSCPLKHDVYFMEVFEIFHFVFGAGRIKERNYFAGEAHVLVAVVDVGFEILFRNFVVHELMIFFKLIFWNYFFHDVMNLMWIS